MVSSKEVEGQISFDFCLDVSNFVVQRNDLIQGRQSLKLNSAKIIRSAIMQIVLDDKDIKPYTITIPELADLLGVSASNIYRDVNDITDDILSNPVFVRDLDDNSEVVRFIKIPWVTRCEYHKNKGLYLKLNDELKPFLVNLKNNYTQYQLIDVLTMKSVYSLRLFELLHSRIMHYGVGRSGYKVTLFINDIRECLDCMDKYPIFANFRERVIDVAVKEISEKTNWKVTYTYQKKGKKVEALDFVMIAWHHA